MTADDNADEVIEASSATEPLRWPDPSRPIINQHEGGVGPGGGGFGGGAGRPGGMPYRKKEEHEEHHRPSYLEDPDPDEVFGTDGPTAPPVIGE